MAQPSTKFSPSAGHAFSWSLNARTSKTSDGRYGPIYQALRDDTGAFITAELVPLALLPEGTSLEGLATQISAALQHPVTSEKVVKFLGYHIDTEREGVFVLTEWTTGGTLWDFVQGTKGAIPLSLACSLTRQIISGLKELGKGPVFLDPKTNILISNEGDVAIIPPVLDLAITADAVEKGQLPVTALTLPKLSPEKADVWLLGVLLAQMLSGNGNLGGTTDSARLLSAAVAGLEGESASELFLSDGLRGNAECVDFLRGCFTM
jgi:serine/threonine protein kinase